MGLFLLHGSPWRRSAERIAEAIGVPSGTSFEADERLKVLLRWGSTERIRFIPEITTINRRECIAKSSDKLAANIWMRDHNISCPQVSTDWRDITFPMIGRTRHHFGGQGVALYMQRSDFERYNTRDYYMPYIPKEVEYRVYFGAFTSVDDGNTYRNFLRRNNGLNHIPCAIPGATDRSYELSTLKVSEKVRLREPTEDALDIIWNWQSGYSYRRPRDQRYLRVVQSALKAAQVFGLDFGAVDVMIGSDGMVYVLEINTAPAVESLHTKNIFSSYLQHTINWAYERYSYTPPFDVIAWEGGEDA